MNNAGITSPGRKDLLEATEDNWDLVFDTNLKGPFFLAQKAARAMIDACGELSSLDPPPPDSLQPAEPTSLTSSRLPGTIEVWAPRGIGVVCTLGRSGGLAPLLARFRRI